MSAYVFMCVYCIRDLCGVYVVNLLVRYQCPGTTNSDIVSAPSCQVSFTPNLNQELSGNFQVHFALPNTRAAAISWSVRTTVFNNVDYGLSGVLKSNGGILYGKTASLVQTTLQPFLFAGDPTAPSVPLTASGLRSFVSEIVLGSTLNVSTADRDSALLLDVSTLTRSDPFEYQPKAVAVTLAFVYTSSGFQYRLNAAGSVLDLLTSISALVGSMVFVGVTQAMQSWEALSLMIARVKKKHSQQTGVDRSRRLSSVELARSVWNMAVEEPQSSQENDDASASTSAASINQSAPVSDATLGHSLRFDPATSVDVSRPSFFSAESTVATPRGVSNPLYGIPLNALTTTIPTSPAAAVGTHSTSAAQQQRFPMRKLQTIVHHRDPRRPVDVSNSAPDSQSGPVAAGSAHSNISPDRDIDQNHDVDHDFEV
jgi:hypothetical protein